MSLRYNCSQLFSLKDYSTVISPGGISFQHRVSKFAVVWFNLILRKESSFDDLCFLF